jgi:hypothetical protein
MRLKFESRSEPMKFAALSMSPKSGQSPAAPCGLTLSPPDQIRGTNATKLVRATLQMFNKLEIYYERQIISNRMN